jgi:hypothetical protein
VPIDNLPVDYGGKGPSLETLTGRRIAAIFILHLIQFFNFIQRNGPIGLSRVANGLSEVNLGLIRTDYFIIERPGRTLTSSS